MSMDLIALVLIEAGKYTPVLFSPIPFPSSLFDFHFVSFVLESYIAFFLLSFSYLSFYPACSLLLRVVSLFSLVFSSFFYFFFFLFFFIFFVPSSLFSLVLGFVESFSMLFVVIILHHAQYHSCSHSRTHPDTASPLLSGDNLPALNTSCKSLSISVQLSGLDSQDTLQHHSQIAALLIDLGERGRYQEREEKDV